MVEAVHGIIGQKYQLFHHQLDNKLLPKVGFFYRIACFLNNTFGKHLNSDVGLINEIVEMMVIQDRVENSLAVEVETHHWNRRKVPYKLLLPSDILDFPEITEGDLKLLFTGSYQLSQAISYLAELMDEENDISAHCLKEKNNNCYICFR